MGEHHLGVDSPRVQRLLQFDEAGGEPTKLLKYVTEPKPDGSTEEGFGLVELIAMDDQGLDGGKLLTLERSYVSGIGTTIYLFESDTSMADDISDCRRVCFDNGNCPDLCGDGEKCCKDSVAVNKKMIFKWNTTGLMSADGSTWQVAVDNYEAMTLVPGPGVMLLLVNDDNKSPQQIGTQFILLKLLETSKQDGSEMTCGEVKTVYKENDCCGNPGKVLSLSSGRRLEASVALNDAEQLPNLVREALSRARTNNPAKAKNLAAKLLEVVKDF